MKQAPLSHLLWRRGELELQGAWSTARRTSSSCWAYIGSGMLGLLGCMVDGIASLSFRVCVSRHASSWTSKLPSSPGNDGLITLSHTISCIGSPSEDTLIAKDSTNISTITPSLIKSHII